MISVSQSGLELAGRDWPQAEARVETVGSAPVAPAASPVEGSPGAAATGLCTLSGLDLDEEVRRRLRHRGFAWE